MERAKAQIILAALCVLTLALGFSCDSTSGVDKPNPARFVLTADKSEGTAPDTVTFTGNLRGDIDTLMMCYPDPFYFCPGGYAKGCIFYDTGCDSTQRARRSYIKTFIYQNPGTYRAVMRLHCRNHSFEDDTVIVQVR